MRAEILLSQSFLSDFTSYVLPPSFTTSSDCSAEQQSLRLMLTVVVISLTKWIRLDYMGVSKVDS